MIAGVVVHGLLVGAVLTLAALAAERVIGSRSGSTRWIWMGALFGSALIPLTGLAQRGAGGPDGGAVLLLDPLSSSPGALPRGGPSLLDRLGLLWAALLEMFGSALAGLGGVLAFLPGGDVGLLVGWTVLTTLAFGVLAASSYRLHRRTRSLPTRVVDGRTVAISGDLGPAVVGVARPRIVLPGWILGSPREALAMVLAHEEEHLAARDTVLLAAALVLAALVPWNPAVWIQLGRLRLAIELDCDRRVVGRGYAPTRYASLLLDVGSRPSRWTPAMAGLAESTSLLERRMRALCLPLPRVSRLLAAVLATATVLLVAVACEVPTPAVEPAASEDEAGIRAVEAPLVPEGAPGTANLADGPTFTPYTMAPQLRNVSRVQEALAEEYPAMLRGAGVGGQVLVHFFITETGEVGDARVAEGSGHEALDLAALRVAKTFEFSPAVNGEEAVPVWIALPITFQAPDADAAGGATEEGTERRIPIRGGATSEGATSERAGAAGEVVQGPRFTPYTVAPRMTNTARVQEAFAEEYPPLLRDAGIGGQVRVHVFISETGEVGDARIATGSGHPALDAAALRVARTFQFQPAINVDEPVAVWIALPINFQAP